MLFFTHQGANCRDDSTLPILDETHALCISTVVQKRGQSEDYLLAAGSSSIEQNVSFGNCEYPDDSEDEIEQICVSNQRKMRKQLIIDFFNFSQKIVKNKLFIDFPVSLRIFNFIMF